MQLTRYSLILAFAAAVAPAPLFAEGFGEKPNNPQLPGVPYVVHDGTRPQPRVVTSGGCVSVKAPSDAKVLFDGTSLDAWTNGKGEPTAWTIKEGALVAGPGALVSREEFGQVQVHLEWRLPAERKVNGQGGGNSGVFFMNLYEVQILQSHDNKTYPDGQAGALYGQKPPLVNATSPQGEWQSYDLIFDPPVYEGEKVISPARVTVIHNGVVVQNAETYYGPSVYRKLASYPPQHPKTGPLALQFHGDPVEYRNIWVRPLGQRDQS